MRFSLPSITVQPRHCDPLFLLRKLGLNRKYCALLESVNRQGTNDYSFLALGARDVITVEQGIVRGSEYVPDGKVPDALSVFHEMINSGDEEPLQNDTHHQTSQWEGERLCMGYIGFLSYEAARQFEDIDLPTHPQIPDAVFVLPEVLLKIDHEKREITIISHKDSQEDFAHIEEVIHSSPFYDETKGRDDSKELPLPTLDEIEPLRQMSRKDYCSAVGKIKEQILAGEVFQVVLSQELLMKKDVSADRVYEELRSLNPSPYMYYYQTPERTIVGASPETLIHIEGRKMLYRPIAGTRRRTGNAEEDERMREELLHDEKERCEHQMLVDLGRNDIGRVAEIGSVQVRDAFHIEQYAHVFHIVSEITGRIKDGMAPLDAVRSVFPAGTLTGAPKVRAMEIIRDVEKAPRGIYGGAFGSIDLAGNVDFAIAIRTMLFQGGKISLRVGAGIVKDSIAEHEDNECLHKVRSCLAAVKLAKTCPEPSRRTSPQKS